MAEPRGGAPRPTGAGGDHRGGAPLGAFASRLAARWVAEAPDERHRSLEGSLVSADLSGFTAMSERLASRGKEGSERLTATVNSCFTALIAAAEREGGDVLKFGGDALLLWFDGDGHAQRAARAGARMQRSIRAARFSRAGLSMTVGGHSGAFDFFLVGRADWRELVVVGRAASTTVELEAAAPSGQVLVSEAMAAALPAAWRGNRDAGGVVLDLAAVALPRRPVPMTESIEVPELVAPTMRADVEALADWSGEHRLATIVFAELEGTDTSVERAGAAFVESVDGLVRAAQEASERYRVQFLYTDIIADGIKLICTAGAPTAHDEDEEAALRFATELVHNDPKRRLRAGVHYGRVFAGFLGSPGRRTYTVMGDPVNLSARLMGKAQPGQVVATAALMHRSRAVFETEALAPFLVKGKSAPIDAVVVGAPTGESRSRDVADVPLVGREEESALLNDAIATAVAGRGQVIEIVGDAGIGKTRLLQSVADHPGFLARVATECQPYDSLSPYAGVRPLLRQALGIGVDATPGVVGDALAATVARVAPHLEPLVPLLAVPLGAAVESTAAADAVAEEFRAERTHEVTVELLTAVLTVPSMLVVEDVYYVDDASLQLLQALAGAVPTRPWMLVVTRRPEGPGRVVGAVEGTLIKLQPLGESVAARLVEAAVGDRRIASVDLEVMAQRSGGNPLFVLQLAEAAGAGVAVDDLPESIERLVATRIDRLLPDDRALLRQAAVIGRVFNVDVLDALLAGDGQASVEAERWIGLSDLIEPEEARTWRFRHALFRDVAYEGLPFARRKRMHRAVGELVEAGKGGEPDVGLLSQHFWLAGDAERTWRYSVAAGDAAWANFAIAEAIAAYRRALGVRRRLKDVDPDAVAAVAEALGDVLERAARYDEAEHAYRLAARISGTDRAAVAVRLIRKRCTVRERVGDFAGAIRLCRRGLTSLPPLPSHEELTEQGELTMVMAGIRHRQGRHLEAFHLFEDALAVAERIGSIRLQAWAHNLIQVAISHLEGRSGTEHGYRALELFEQIGDVRRQASALANIGLEQQLRGRWIEAAQAYAASADLSQRSGDAVHEALVRNNHGELLSDQGHFARAAEEFGSAERAWSRASYGIGLAVVALNRGILETRRGALDAGYRLLVDAVQRFMDLGAASYALEARIRLAENRCMAGDVDIASGELDEVASQLASVEVFGYSRAALFRLSGWVHLQRGEGPEAARAFTTAVDTARRHGARYEIALSLEGLAVVTKLQGSPSHSELRSESRQILSGLGVVEVVPVPLPI